MHTTTSSSEMTPLHVDRARITCSLPLYEREMPENPVSERRKFWKRKQNFEMGILQQLNSLTGTYRTKIACGNAAEKLGLERIHLYTEQGKEISVLVTFTLVDGEMPHVTYRVEKEIYYDGDEVILSSEKLN